MSVEYEIVESFADIKYKDGKIEWAKAKNFNIRKWVSSLSDKFKRDILEGTKYALINDLKEDSAYMRGLVRIFILADQLSAVNLKSMDIDRFIAYIIRLMLSDLEINFDDVSI